MNFPIDASYKGTWKSQSFYDLAALIVSDCLLTGKLSYHYSVEENVLIVLVNQLLFVTCFTGFFFIIKVDWTKKLARLKFY